MTAKWTGVGIKTLSHTKAEPALTARILDILSRTSPEYAEQQPGNGSPTKDQLPTRTGVFKNER